MLINCLVSLDFGEATEADEGVVVTDAVEGRDLLVTGAVTEEVVLAAAMAAWWRAARWRLCSICVGSWWRGWRRGGVAGWEEGREWGALGWPSVQLKPTVAWPLLVVRLREAVPPRAQTCRNLFTEAVRKCEFVLVNIFEIVLELK